MKKLSPIAPLILLTLSTLLGLPACTVKYTYTKPDYETVEKQRLKKVVLVQTFEPSADESPAPVSQEKKALLFALVSREFITHHHEYIVLRPKGTASFSDPAAYCATDRRLDGIIVSRFKQWKKNGGSVKLEVQSTLYDCSSGARIWEALARNSYESEDSSLTVLIQSYSKRVGEEIRSSVAPVYLLVRSLFASLPDPSLNPTDVDAKIEADADW